MRRLDGKTLRARAGISAAIALSLFACGAIVPTSLYADSYSGWRVIAGERHWFDSGVEARSKEIFDPGSQAWYWIDADGTMAHDKDVYLPSSGGKWVRYDSQGHMIKGEDYRYGGWYYFDIQTGAMVKGTVFVPSNGGKWVYYDTVTGKMAHGLAYLDYDAFHTGWYYFDINTGAMQKGNVYVPEWGKWCVFDAVTGKYLYDAPVSSEYKRALASAGNYLRLMAFSKEGLYDQLTSSYGEGFPSDAARYAVNSVSANWNEECLEDARSYLDLFNFSNQSLRDQLKYEKYTDSEIDYAMARI